MLSLNRNKIFGLLCGAVMLFASSAYAAKGDIVYSYKDGKIQFLSEKTPEGKTVGLLKTLNSNTEVSSIKIDANRGLLSFMMIVKEENPICASWTACHYPQLTTKKFIINDKLLF